MNPSYAMQAQKDTMAGAVSTRKPDITLRQNLAAQIEMCEARLRELNETRDRLEKVGILDMRIDDAARAMSW